MAFQDTLEKRAEKMFQSVFGWEQKALIRIGKRVKGIGSLSYADLQSINNYAKYRGMSEKDFFKKYAADLAKIDADAVMEDLAKLTGQNVRETKQIYADTIDAQHEANKALYDYRNKPYVPFAENKELQALVDAYSRTTAESFVNFSMTKANAIGFVDVNGVFNPIHKSFTNVLDKAVMSVATGTGTFGAEMRDVLRELGGSGVVVKYPSGVTRSLDSMVRQNLLWGAKQASREYSRIIGEELGCDGIEIDWHSNPRPSHEFMQGKQFVLGKSRTINGIDFESADKAQQALDNYGCLHFETPIICGVSEPTYSPAELEELNRQNADPIEIDGVTKTGYEWKQTMRRLEREGRKAKLQRETLKASGDNIGADEAERTLKAIRKKEKRIMDKYENIADRTGIKAQREKMSFVKGKDASIPNGTASVKNATPTPKKISDVPKTIEQINKKGTKGIERIVDDRIDSQGLNLIKPKDISKSAITPYSVDLAGIEAKNADVIVDTVEELSGKYKTTIQGYRTGKKGEFFGRSGTFATTEYNSTTASSDIVFNKAKVDDIDRIKELSQKGWSVKVKEGFEDRYVATHEFAHTIVPNTTIPLKNYVGYDIKPQQSARSKLKALFEEYKEKVQGLQREFNQADLDYIMGDGSAGEKARAIKAHLDSIKISDYSLGNVDEFMAEAFTSHEIGTVHTEYEKRVMDIIIKFFGK